MSSEIFKASEKEIRDRYEKANLIVLDRKQKIYIEYPILKELDFRIKSTASKIAKVTFERPANYQEQVEEIIKQNSYDQQQIKQILTSAGYSHDYLEKPYTCKNCNDSGYVLGKMCDCFKKLLTQKRIENLNAKSYFKGNHKFETFSLNYYTNPQDRQIMTEIYNNCIEYAVNFNKNSKNLIMTGGTGLGKTHLSFSIARYVVEQGFTSLHFSAPELFRILNDEFFGKGQPGVNTIDLIKEADLFILDDLGAEVDGKVVIPMLYNIIEVRLNLDKPTIISTNLSLINIEKKYNDKIASRLLSYVGAKFVGKDIRQLKSIENKKPNN